MADTRFVVKHGLVVNGSFTANGSVVNAASISATALSIGVVSVNATTINVGTTTVNSTTFSGTANNSTNFNGQPASFYTNASNISSGTLPAARLSGTYTITVSSANNASFLGGVAAASYQTTAGLAANVATLTANNSTNFDGQNSSFYTNIPARLGYTPVNKAGDTTMTGDYSTSGTSISVGRGEAGEKRLVFHNSGRYVYFYLAADGNGAGLWDVTGGAFRFSTDTSGNFSARSNITAYASDARLKENIRAITTTPLEDVKKLSGYRFEWREDGPQPMRGTDVGLIAQEVEKVIPEAVTAAPFDSEYKTLKMNQQVTALLIEAIKELTSKVEALERKIDTL